jgi:hypothetical protein
VPFILLLSFYLFYLFLKSIFPIYPPLSPSFSFSLTPDIREKARYAAYKAYEIRKAIKEGRKPNAGPPSNPHSIEEALSLSEPSLSNTSLSNPSSSSSASSFTPSLSMPSQTQFSHSSTDEPGSLPSHSLSNAFASISLPSALSLSCLSNDPSLSTPLPSRCVSGDPSLSFSSPSNFYDQNPSLSLQSPNNYNQAPSLPPSLSLSPSPNNQPFSPPPNNQPLSSLSSPVSLPPFKAPFSLSKPSKEASIKETERLLKHAMTAVLFSDVDTALKKLQEAAHYLTPYADPSKE